MIDGVYRPRNGVGFGDLGEIERIEVLKGPQGTVFGKNTSAGVINVITRRPSYTTSAEGEITIGNYNALGVSGAFNTAVGDNSAIRVYAAKRKRDGFMDVRTGAGPRTETEDYDQNFHSLRGQWLFEPTDTLDINVIADFTSREENCCTGVTVVRGATAGIIDALAPDEGVAPVADPTDTLDINVIADFTSREENCCTGVTVVRGATAGIIDALAPDEGVAPVADPFARVAWSNRSTEQDIKDGGVSAEVNWVSPWLGNATLTSITAQRQWDAINGLDFDFSTADLLY
ncbi:TonB-dependent receptor plug domain-containing protein, partial [Novilysobacter viscosus]|uniref:TonB-dependent receptor plug domain-containing protein n=1 Tax=Novilysobacter viscosus TaxID=3098602 RepID=UPI003F884CDB